MLETPNSFFETPQLACSTCHVVLEEPLYDSLEEPSDDENDMLDLAFALTDTSRLGCQVKAKAPVDTKVVSDCWLRSAWAAQNVTWDLCHCQHGIMIRFVPRGHFCKSWSLWEGPFLI
jgi:hypothetical protein